MISFNLQSDKRSEYIQLSAEELKQGKIAILPTSTIYGISCLCNDSESLKKVYEIKKRPQNLPFIVLLTDISDIGMFVDEITASAKILIEKYWRPIKAGGSLGPDISRDMSPLTLVFKRKKSHQEQKTLMNTGETIALRLDPLEILWPLLKICGPVISTSATISGAKTSPKRIEDIPESIKHKVDIIVDFGFDLPGTPSTILDVTGKKPVLLREGRLKYSEIRAIL